MTTPDSPDMMSWHDLLEASVSQIYKHDRRSCVWRVEDARGQAYVVKRFEYSPLRQRLAMMLGMHPAQAEMRKAAALARAEVAVTPILAMHRQKAAPAGAGVKVHLFTPWLGQSLQQARREKLPVACEATTAEQLLARLGELVSQLLIAGWVFRDLKTSNILIDEQSHLRLIDVGSARRIKPITQGEAPARAWRMLGMLNHTLAQDGWPVDARRACLARPLAIISPLPVTQAHEILEKARQHA